MKHKNVYNTNVVAASVRFGTTVWHPLYLSFSNIRKSMFLG